ncbi:hypothetical protein ACFL5O_02725 [Myxococcota bacterium]
MACISRDASSDHGCPAPFTLDLVFAPYRDEVLALAKQGLVISTPKDVVKNAFVLESLDLQERRAWLEREEAGRTLRLTARDPDDAE